MPDDRAAIDLPRLRAALARLKEGQDRLRNLPPRVIWEEDARARDDLFRLARDLPAADLLALVGEVERLREAAKGVERAQVQLIAACDAMIFRYIPHPDPGRAIGTAGRVWDNLILAVAQMKRARARLDAAGEAEDAYQEAR